MNNRQSGTGFEEEFCEILSQNGFWAHNMTQNKAGQPADVIAVRFNTPYLIDCKVCEKDRFPLSRIEPNQEAAMELWLDCMNDYCYFAIKYNEVIYMVHYRDITEREGIHDVSAIKPTEYPTLEEWLCE